MAACHGPKHGVPQFVLLHGQDVRGRSNYQRSRTASEKYLP